MYSGNQFDESVIIDVSEGMPSRSTRKRWGNNRHSGFIEFIMIQRPFQQIFYGNFPFTISILESVYKSFHHQLSSVKVTIRDVLCLYFDYLVYFLQFLGLHRPQRWCVTFLPAAYCWIRCYSGNFKDNLFRVVATIFWYQLRLPDSVVRYTFSLDEKMYYY